MALDEIRTDDSRWPIVVHSTIGIPSEEQVDAFIRRADGLLARGEPHAVVFDSTRAGRATSYMRKRNLEWLRANQDRLSQSCVGVAMVLRSATLRFVLSTVMLVWRQPVPYEIFASLDDAMAWSTERLRANAA